MSINETEDGKIRNQNIAIEKLEAAIYDCASIQVPIADVLFAVHRTYRREMSDHLQLEPKTPKYLRKEEF